MKNLSRLFLALCGLALGLLIAEDVVRHLGLAPAVYQIAINVHRLSDVPDLGYELVPDFAYGGEAINSDGRRDFDYPRQKEAGVFRIVDLGDSVTYGWGTSLWEAHPKVIEYELNRFRKSDTPRYEVLNFGVRGYNTLNEAACLKEKALAWDPDLVIVSYYHNDPDPYSVDFLGLLEQRDDVGKKFMEERHRTSSRARTWLFQHSKLYTFARFRWMAYQQKENEPQFSDENADRVRTYNGKVNYDLLKTDYFFRVADDFWPRIVDGFGQVRDAADSAGIPVIVAIFPILDNLSHYPYEALHRRVAETAAQAGFHVVDTLPAFQRVAGLTNQSLAVDYNHPNWLGQRVAANAIVKQLIRDGLVPTSSDGFDAKLFSDDAVLEEPDYGTVYADRPMFWIEAGHRDALGERWENAAQTMLTAEHLSPGNPIVKRTLEDAAAHLDGELLAETRASLSRYSRSSTASAD